MTCLHTNKIIIKKKNVSLFNFPKIFRQRWMITSSHSYSICLIFNLFVNNIHLLFSEFSGGVGTSIAQPLEYKIYKHNFQWFYLFLFILFYLKNNIIIFFWVCVYCGHCLDCKWDYAGHDHINRAEKFLCSMDDCFISSTNQFGFSFTNHFSNLQWITIRFSPLLIECCFLDHLHKFPQQSIRCPSLQIFYSNSFNPD